SFGPNSNLTSSSRRKTLREALFSQLNPHFSRFLRSLSACAYTHSFCDAIHSEDTNLFRFMKTPIPVVVGGPVVRGPVVGGPAVPGPAVRGLSPLSHPLSSTLVALALCGCTGTRALKGGKAFTARTPAGGVSQVLLQGENPSQAT